MTISDKLKIKLENVHDFYRRRQSVDITFETKIGVRRTLFLKWGTFARLH